MLPLRPRDVGLFLRSARSDARIREWRTGGGLEEGDIFGRLYAEAPEQDPWASASPRYLYQRRKYDRLAAFLPPGRFRAVLDLGCGLGLFTEHLAARADSVVATDVAVPAVEAVRRRFAGRPHVEAVPGDVRDLPASWDGRFDLVVVADTIYYLPPACLTEDGLKRVAARVARLLSPGGALVLANHDFSAWDPESRLSRRIHAAFRWSPSLQAKREERFAFFRATLLRRTAANDDGEDAWTPPA